jgi:protein-L-isoaspartate O-methyltransferase
MAILKNIIVKILDTSFGRRLVLLYLSRNKEICINFLQASDRFSLQEVNVGKAASIRGFEDLSFLFSSSKANRGAIRLNFDEAAYLFTLVKSIRACKILEIGRFEGGSTILFASAGDDQSKVTSIDKAPKNDTHLKKLLIQWKLNKKVELIIADANDVDISENEYDIVFIDGGHAYSSASKDYHHWKNSLKLGGHMIFHDCDNSEPGVVKVCNEILNNDSNIFEEWAQTSSLKDFVRID